MGLLLKQIIRHGKLLSQLKLVLIFTVLYWMANKIEVKHNMKILDNTGNTTDNPVKPVSLFYAFYFSLVTQTTVGYGKDTPSTKLTQVLNILQLLSIFGVYLL